MLLETFGANPDSCGPNPASSFGQTGPNFSTFQAADLEISQETLAAAVSGCVDGCWEGFVKGREGGPSTTVPWRKERLDRLDGIFAGGPTEEQEEQLSLTHRLHTNVHAGTQTQWCPGRLHAQPQNKAVHCSRRAPPDRRTKAGPQDGHRNRLCRKGLATGSNFNRHFGQLLSGFLARRISFRVALSILLASAACMPVST